MFRAATGYWPSLSATCGVGKQLATERPHFVAASKPSQGPTTITVTSHTTPHHFHCTAGIFLWLLDIAKPFANDELCHPEPESGAASPAEPSPFSLLFRYVSPGSAAATAPSPPRRRRSSCQYDTTAS